MSMIRTTVTIAPGDQPQAFTDGLANGRVLLALQSSVGASIALYGDLQVIRTLIVDADVQLTRLANEREDHGG